MARYWVVGGEYDSTEFRTIAGGGSPLRAGPYASYEEALRKWQELAWRSVDNCNVRFHIEIEETAARVA